MSELKELGLNKKDFAEISDQKYATVLKWSYLENVPSWVKSWIENYKYTIKYKNLVKNLPNNT
jgi:hypothetical protein